MMPAVMAGQNEIGSRAVEIRREQQLRVGNDNVVGVGGIDVDYGSVAAVTALLSRTQHAILPLPSERDQKSPSLPAARRRPSRSPQRPPNTPSMRHSQRAGKKNDAHNKGELVPGCPGHISMGTRRFPGEPLDQSLI